MPRLTYFAGVALVLVGGALALTHDLLRPWPRVNVRNVRRVKPEMTMQEVEAIFGRKPDAGFLPGGNGWTSFPGAQTERWGGAGGCLLGGNGPAGRLFFLLAFL